MTDQATKETNDNDTSVNVLKYFKNQTFKLIMNRIPNKPAKKADEQEDDKTTSTDKDQ